MSARRNDPRKGTFGDRRLPVAGVYVRPPARHRPWLIGGALAAVLALALVIGALMRDAGVLSPGPLSSAHATLGKDCAACHLPGEGVANAQCAVCHEKFGDQLGDYTFAAHYVYRSNDFQRVVPSEHEMPCASCHPEHRGRSTAITQVADQQCQPCHPYRSFNDRHPQFAFAAEQQEDPAGLAFTHIRHVREVMQRQQLEDVERACLYCHQPRADGRRFQPIDFERSCETCHLTSTATTPRLPIRDPAAADSVGVDTLETIRARNGPDDQWARFLSPSEFRQVGSRVSKSPLYHRDPWVLANLRALRHRLYPDAGLADLLVATPEVPPWALETLYREAIDTLETQAAGLRGRPEAAMQDELRRIGELLSALRRALRDPYTPLDETAFPLALSGPPAALDEEQAAAIGELVEELTAPCRQCHSVERATIARVQKDQGTLRRAEFDHRAHILQARCLDCHTQIPILDAVEGRAEPTEGEDRAAIQNLPTIERCQECHTPRLAANTCITCHRFHPDQNRHAELLLYLDEPPPDQG